ncbi:MAG: hypothetical protein EOP10_08015 [Proteobacteria bacterium]|nr:MAG: hypothetical protein EOP10_08015 [Pseudomonadota bacterium]
MKSIILGFILAFFSSSAWSAESISVPPMKQFQDLKKIYKTDGTPQILLVLHLPNGPGKAFIEVYNHTGRNLGIFQFSVHSVGQIGDLSFEDIPSGWSGVKETGLSNIRELTIISPRAIDDKANEFNPKLVIHYEIGKIKKFSGGTKKIKP